LNCTKISYFFRSNYFYTKQQPDFKPGHNCAYAPIEEIIRRGKEQRRLVTKRGKLVEGS
jgi:hypothetical protein